MIAIDTKISAFQNQEIEASANWIQMWEQSAPPAGIRDFFLECLKQNLIINRFVWIQKQKYNYIFDDYSTVRYYAWNADKAQTFIDQLEAVHKQFWTDNLFHFSIESAPVDMTLPLETHRVQSSSSPHPSDIVFPILTVDENVCWFKYFPNPDLLDGANNQIIAPELLIDQYLDFFPETLFDHVEQNRSKVWTRDDLPQITNIYPRWSSVDTN